MSSGIIMVKVISAAESIDFLVLGLHELDHFAVFSEHLLLLFVIPP